MTDRADLIQNFLSSTPWASADRSLLAGDASNRRYERLCLENPEKTAVLMDAPSEKGEDIRPFVRIAKHLSACGLSAPDILFEDAANGFLLLEDLGDDLFARVAATQPDKESELYEAAIDALIELHQHAAPDGIQSYTPQMMAELSTLTYDWYLFGATGTKSQSCADHFCGEFSDALKQLSQTDQILILRDYHAENLIWLPDRNEARRVGLLDFQDAMLGHSAYDIVSLLEDARRDVPRDLIEPMLIRYAAQTGHDKTELFTAFHILGAQRNLRIIGVFARLSLHYGKAHYIDLIPRVWGHLMHDLSHPTLTNIHQIILQDIPAPSAEILNTLKEKCATVPTI